MKKRIPITLIAAGAMLIALLLPEKRVPKTISPPSRTDSPSQPPPASG